MSEVSTHLIKLQTDASGENFLIAKSEISDTDINLTILDNDSAFLVNIEKDSLKESGEKMRLAEIEEWADEAFSTSSSPNFVFSLTDETLTWRKSGGSKVKIKIGSFPAQKINFSDAQKQVFEAATSKIDEHTAGLQKSSEKVAKLEEALKESHEKMEEFCRDKSELETKMLEQFLPILQAKKDKLRNMRANSEKRSSQNLKNSRAKDDDDEDDDYGSGTDVDEDVEEGTKSKKSKLENTDSMNDSQNFLNI